jgi:hypothetical protein
MSGRSACSQKWLHIFFAAALLLPAAAAAQVQTGDEEQPSTIMVALAGYTLEPELDEDGVPVLDDDGQPVLLRVPLDDSVIVPGDDVLYVITLSNPTLEVAVNLQLAAQVAPEVLLDPYSFVGPEGFLLEWADIENPDQFRPVFVEIEGETEMQADLEVLRILRLTLPELPPTGEISIEYTVTLR